MSRVCLHLRNPAPSDAPWDFFAAPPSDDDSIAYLHYNEVATVEDVAELARKIERLEAVALRATALQEEVVDLRQQVETWENLVAGLRLERERLHDAVIGIFRLAGMALQI